MCVKTIDLLLLLFFFLFFFFLFSSALLSEHHHHDNNNNKKIHTVGASKSNIIVCGHIMRRDAGRHIIIFNNKV